MFRVRWKQAAINDLATLWMNADAQQRRAITQATDLIDRQLQVDPEIQGESRPRNRRILFAAPLGILFRVDPQQQLVRVLQIWRF